MTEDKVSKLFEITHSIKKSRVYLELSGEELELFNRLDSAILELSEFVEAKFQEMSKIAEITSRINSAVLLDEVFNYTFDAFRNIIPYNRIGVSLLSQGGDVVRAIWAKSDAPHLKISKGYSARLSHSSLRQIISTNQPRIINDLQEYLQQHPHSESTQRILEEGMRSSLTFPLIALGKPIGFIFFSSVEKNTYRDIHQNIFIQIANQFSMIVEKSRLYDELLQKNQQLKAQDQLKNEFISTVSHELNTPLTIIYESINQLLDGLAGEVPDQQKRLLTGAGKNCQRLGRLITDLLDLSKIEANKLTLNKEHVDLVNVVKEAVSSHQILISEKNLGIKVECAPESITIRVDPARLFQIFSNLLSNAVRYSEQGTITVSVKEHSDHILCSVQDQGRGISPEDLPKAFDKFEQFNRKSKGGYQGTGLGLTIVKRLVELHGGDIWIKSKLGEGTTLNFTLPKLASHDYLRQVLTEIIKSPAHDKENTLSVITIQLHNIDEFINTKPMDQPTQLFSSIENCIWNSLGTTTGRVIRAHHGFWLVLPQTNREAAFNLGEIAHHNINRSLLEEFPTNQLRISWQVINYPENSSNLDEIMNYLEVKETPS